MTGARKPIPRAPCPHCGQEIAASGRYIHEPSLKCIARWARQHDLDPYDDEADAPGWGGRGVKPWAWALAGIDPPLHVAVRARIVADPEYRAALGAVWLLAGGAGPGGAAYYAPGANAVRRWIEAPQDAAARLKREQLERSRKEATYAVNRLERELADRKRELNVARRKLADAEAALAASAPPLA